MPFFIEWNKAITFYYFEYLKVVIFNGQNDLAYRHKY